MICPSCEKKQVSRIDIIFVEIFGGCWVCIRENSSDEEFNNKEKLAIIKKYENEK